MVLRLWSLVSLTAVFLAGSGFVASARAQSSPDVQVVRFSVFALRPVADLVFKPRPNAEPRSPVFYPTARSPRYEYQGAMPLQLTDGGSGEVVAEATIPSTISDALLLLLPVAKEGDARFRYRVAVLDDSAAQLKAGEVGIINLSGLALSGTVNGANVTLGPGVTPPMPVGRSGRVTLRTVLKGRSYQSFTGAIPLGANQRAWLILFPPYYSGSLEVQSRVLVDSLKR